MVAIRTWPRTRLQFDFTDINLLLAVMTLIKAQDRIDTCLGFPERSPSSSRDRLFDRVSSDNLVY